MTDTELKMTMTAYQHIRDKFTHDQIATLSTMLYRLDQSLATKEALPRERVNIVKKSPQSNASTTTIRPKTTKIRLLSGNGKSVVDPSIEELA